MQPLSVVLSQGTRLNAVHLLIPSFVQVRWKKIPKRKPRWLPTARSKLFRIPQHPIVPPDERQTMDDLLDEYYRKQDSLRKLFQEELKHKEAEEGTLLEQQAEEEKRFRTLLEENKKENERIRVIREKVMEERFQAKILEILQLEEERQKEIEAIRLEVDEIVRKEKKKSLSYINEGNLDQAIEYAIDNPININFAISLDGTVTWEDKPPPEYEAEIKRRVAEGLKTS